MSLSKTYEPAKHEAEIYELWEESGAFKPSGEGEPYSIVMPPPNANASLHIGMGLTIAIQDILIRYHRMKGCNTLYLPGADHAGFETQVVYEKHLAKEGKSRFDFNREELYKQVWDFVDQNKGHMQHQMREMGASVDWSKFTFTLDDHIVKRAYKTFKDMWDDGLIYRGERLVNFCTHHGTSFADLEVEYKDESSHLWEISYPLPDGSDELIVATTRPETMFGDVAVAVHPDDERYKHLVGKKLMLPIAEREIPVITDEMVDIEFGTGAVKITPAHDQNDFEVGERHKLPRINVINFDGTINENAPEKYRNMSIKDARKAVVEDLKTHDYLVAEAEYQHSVGHCYKCGTVIQPLLKDQWFISMKPLAKKAIQAIKDGEIRFFPANRQNTGIAYLENIRDWNISRQIAWGIPIPAFQNIDNPDDWIFDDRVEEETIEVKGKTYMRDPDVFDTWFSSGQWPFATMKYPDGEDSKTFYPLSVMETGGEIFNFWVLRMVMLGLYVTDEVPFKDVYIHGYVMAEDGSKMSKSIGNVISPQEILEQYGSDALRIGIVGGRKAGVNQNFSHSRFTAGRNFANKLWNVARFIEGTESSGQGTEKNLAPKSAADHWILRELDVASKDVANILDDYRFSEALELVYHTIWDKVADWYLEASKTAPSASVMHYVLEACLKIAHPFAPFVTEAIWQHTQSDDSLLITSSWPVKVDFDGKKAKEFEVLQAVIREVREVLTEVGTTNIALLSSSKVVLANSEMICKLSRAGFVEEVNEGRGLKLTSIENTWIDLTNEDLAKYHNSLKQRLSKIVVQAEVLERRLSNESYVKNAPENLVAESRDELQELSKQREHLDKQLKHAEL